MALVRVDWRPTPRKLRQFGLAALVIFGGLAVAALVRHHLLFWSLAPATARTAAWALGGLAGAAGLAAVVAPRVLLPLYLGMTVVGIPIGYVVSHVVLAIVYFGVVTPTGLLVRLFRGDPMSRRWERERASYLTPRVPSPPRRYFRSF